MPNSNHEDRAEDRHWRNEQDEHADVEVSDE